MSLRKHEGKPAAEAEYKKTEIEVYKYVRQDGKSYFKAYYLGPLGRGETFGYSSWQAALRNAKKDVDECIDNAHSLIVELQCKLRKMGAEK